MSARSAQPVPMKNVMSVDVEDWFCVYNLSRLIPYAEWDECESRVERSTTRLLDVFRKHAVEATFFVLGWVADRFPDLVREIERRGHEVATHGYSHRLLTFMRPEEFRQDVDFSIERLVDQIDPPRFFPLVGPAQLHHCHYKCTVFYTETVQSDYPIPFQTKRRRVEVVYIDRDHLHMFACTPEQMQSMTTDLTQFQP